MIILKSTDAGWGFVCDRCGYQYEADESSLVVRDRAEIHLIEKHNELPTIRRKYE